MVKTTRKSPTQLEKHITGIFIVIAGIFGRSFYQSILFQPRWCGPTRWVIDKACCHWFSSMKYIRPRRTELVHQFGRRLVRNYRVVGIRPRGGQSVKSAVHFRPPVRNNHGQSSKSLQDMDFWGGLVHIIWPIWNPWTMIFKIISENDPKKSELSSVPHLLLFDCIFPARLNNSSRVTHSVYDSNSP